MNEKKYEWMGDAETTVEAPSNEHSKKYYESNRHYDAEYKPTQDDIKTFPDLQNGPSSLIQGSHVGIQQVGIHNFKLPEFRVSQDAISGMEIPVWFKATMTSEEFLETTSGGPREGKGFEIACAQLCGLGHYRMKGYLTVHNEEGFANWMDEQQEYLLEEAGDDDDDWGDDEW